VKQNDHAMDDIRYFAASVGGRSGAAFGAAWAGEMTRDGLRKRLIM
jgi:hypothetical protein